MRPTQHQGEHVSLVICLVEAEGILIKCSDACSRKEMNMCSTIIREGHGNMFVSDFLDDRSFPCSDREGGKG